MKNGILTLTLLSLLTIGCLSKDIVSTDKTKVYPALCVKLDSTKGDTTKLLALLAEATPILGQNDSLTAMIYHKLGLAYYSEQNNDKALAYYKQSLQIRQSIFSPNHRDIAKSHLNMAKTYNTVYEYSQAINHAKMATGISQKTVTIDTFELGDAHLTLGQSQLQIGELSGAINNIELAAKYFSTRLEDDKYKKVTARCYKLLAVNFKEQRLFNQGIEQSMKALPIFQYLKKQGDIADVYNNLGLAYRGLNQPKEALNALNQSLKINQEEERDEDKANNFIELAKVYLIVNELNKAKTCADSSFVIRQKVAKNDLPETYAVLGQIAEAQQKPDSALFFYQKALQTIDTTFKNNDVLINPTINAKTFNRKIELINLLKHKADPLSILYKKTKNNAYLIAALETYQLADKLVQALRRDMQDDQSKYFWNETALPIYKKGIDVAYQLFDLTQDAQYKLVMLQFSERTKAPVLREGIADNKAKGFAGVPAAERQRERELRATIAILEEQTTDNAKITEQLVKTRTQLYAFQDSLKIKYPNYARYLAATSDDTPLSINDLKRVQKQLSDTTLIIEYAFGSHDLYQIAISNTDFSIFKTPLTPDFYAQIDRFNYAVNDYDAIKKDFNATGRAYAATSFDLYQRLLEQPLMHTGHSSNLKTDSSKSSVFKRVHLILDNQLHLSSFKAFTDKPVKGWIGDFPEHFLVKKYAFSSLFSIQTLLKSTLPKNNRDKQSESLFDTANLKLACFVLDFKDTTLYPKKTSQTNIKIKKNSVLEGAESEKTGISKYFNGRPYFNKDATKAVFLKDAPQYDFLHITTHGYPEGLVFQKSNATDSLNEVSIGDIYGLSLNTRFTFLSACETGKGKQTEAEGVMSLGRAFSFAGSKSVIMSLWSIPDGSTSKIAQSFYNYYHQGLPKDIAEQRAEIDFLNTTSSDAQMLPNHWAALTIIGDISPLEQPQTTTNWWVWGLLACIVFFSLLFVFKSKKEDEL